MWKTDSEAAQTIWVLGTSPEGIVLRDRGSLLSLHDSGLPSLFVTWVLTSLYSWQFPSRAAHGGGGNVCSPQSRAHPLLTFPLEYWHGSPLPQVIQDDSPHFLPWHICPTSSSLHSHPQSNLNPEGLPTLECSVEPRIGRLGPESGTEYRCKLV